MESSWIFPLVIRHRILIFSLFIQNRISVFAKHSNITTISITFRPHPDSISQDWGNDRVLPIFAEFHFSVWPTRGPKPWCVGVHHGGWWRVNHRGSTNSARRNERSQEHSHSKGMICTVNISLLLLVGMYNIERNRECKIV